MKNVIMLAGAALLVSGCGGGSGINRSFDTAPVAGSAGAVVDYPVKIGEPYELGGVTYTPSDAYNYDETGYASWYGKEMVGRSTANGESFVAEAISGAHRTLPLPSYAEVTALDTGKTILVRLNDRGPVSPDRLIDLSYGAARQLGIAEKGVTAVRVRRVNPPESERVLLRAGQPVAMRMETPESLLVPLRRRLGEPRPPVAMAAAAPGTTATPAPAPAPAPVRTRKPNAGKTIVEGAAGRPQMVESSTGDNRTTLQPGPAAPAQAGSGAGYFVQVAAFSTRARADALAKKIGATTFASADGKLFRVRYGPYADAEAAQQGLTLAKRNGYQGVRILKDTGR